LLFGTIAFDPLGQLYASARNFIRQLVDLDTSEFLLNASETADLYTNPQYALFERIVPGAAGCADEPELCVPRLPRKILQPSIVFGFLGALAGSIILIAARSASRPACATGDWRRAVTFFGLAGLLLISNAFICGVLSEPVGRYQVRIIWLFPICFCTFAVLDFLRRSGEDGREEAGGRATDRGMSTGETAAPGRFLVE
jgi:hypothetical protein